MEEFVPFLQRPDDPPAVPGSAAQRLEQPRYPARIAVYDDMIAPPRVIVIEPCDITSYLTQIIQTVYQLMSEQGGDLPHSMIRELVENFIHASFIEPTISILDKGQTLVFSDQGPGIANKAAALKPSFSTATNDMKRYIRGVGSGLPMVESYLKMRNGTMTIEDNLGHGTIVTVSFAERAKQQAATQEEPPQPVQPSQALPQTGYPGTAQAAYPAASQQGWPASPAQGAPNWGAAQGAPQGWPQGAPQQGYPYPTGAQSYPYGQATAPQQGYPYGQAGWGGWPTQQAYPSWPGAWPGTAQQAPAQGWPQQGIPGTPGPTPPYAGAPGQAAPYGGAPTPYGADPAAASPFAAAMPGAASPEAPGAWGTPAPALDARLSPVLLVFAREPHVGGKELQAALGLSAATASRRLKDLEAAGLAVKAGQKYTLTPQGAQALALINDESM